TTGILVGIGETLAERAESIFAIRQVARQFGHVQEVIVQNFRAKPDTALRHHDDLGHDEYLAALATSRIVLGPKMRLQAPPNLTDPGECGRLLAAGVDDWGGVSPLTPDHVNPERPWPSLERLREITAEAGFELVARLTAHPEYVRRSRDAGDPWIDPRVLGHVSALDTPACLARHGIRLQGRTWQEPEGGFAQGAGVGRTDLHTAIDTEGRTQDRRADFDTVYGDWQTLRDQVARGTGAGSDGATGEVLESEVKAALRQAERDPQQLTDEQALPLMQVDGAGLVELCGIADGLRRDAVRGTGHYVGNRHSNVGNVCYVGRRFCACAQRGTDADACPLSHDQVGGRGGGAWADGATGVCMQGGIEPELPGTAYFGLAAAV